MIKLYLAGFWMFLAIIGTLFGVNPIMCMIGVAVSIMYGLFWDLEKKIENYFGQDTKRYID